jgi:hypothetical protein
MLLEASRQLRHFHQRRGAGGVGDDDRGGGAREIDGLENAAAEIAVGVPQHKTQMRIVAFGSKVKVVREHIDADRRLVIGFEFIEHETAGERGLAHADIAEQHDFGGDHRMSNSRA